MAALRCFILFISCLILVTASSHIEEQQQADLYKPDNVALYYDYVPVLSRQARSPQNGGRFEYRFQKDRFGRENTATFGRDGQSGGLNYRDDKYGGRSAGAQYNQNLYTSKDGHVTFDAYAGANRNFDLNRNEGRAGIKGAVHW